MLNYKDYQQVRNNVWKLLIDAKIKELPIKILTLCDNLGIEVRYFDRQAENESDGKSILINNRPYILVAKDCTNERKRFTTAHELGHILLGHLGKYKLVNREPSAFDNEIETEANMFAARLLAPACVLWGCNVTNSEQIQKLCQISKPAADFRMERMKVLYERNKFLTHPLEKIVYKQFREFIKNNKF